MRIISSSEIISGISYPIWISFFTNPVPKDRRIKMCKNTPKWSLFVYLVKIGVSVSKKEANMSI